MKTILFLMLGLTLGFTPAAVRAQSQAQMNADAAAELEAADEELNAIYGKLMKDNKDNGQFCSDLKEAQRAWLKFVEYHMKTAFPLEEGENPREVYGSIYPMEYANLKTQLTNERAEQLKQLSPDP